MDDHRTVLRGGARQSRKGDGRLAVRADVRAAFGFDPAVEAVSLYAYAPVFRLRDASGDWVVKRTGNAHSTGQAIAAWLAALRAEGIDVVAPAPGFPANPVRMPDGGEWVVYPFVDGEAYRGLTRQIGAAGRLLGCIHAAGQSGASKLTEVAPLVPHDAAWVDRHAASARESLATTRRDAARFEDNLATTRPLGPFAGTLPVVGCCFDFKAANLVFAPRPILIDPDHAARLPRLYDLATALLLFHNDAPSAPHRLWDVAEWRCFLAGYLENTSFGAREHAAWPHVLGLAWRDKALWLLANFPEGWADPDEAGYLADLASADLTAYPLA